MKRNKTIAFQGESTRAGHVRPRVLPAPVSTHGRFPETESPIYPAFSGQFRMGRQVSVFPMHGHRDLRADVTIHGGQLIPRRMTGDMNERVFPGDDLASLPRQGVFAGC